MAVVGFRVFKEWNVGNDWLLLLLLSELGHLRNGLVMVFWSTTDLTRAALANTPRPIASWVKTIGSIAAAAASQFHKPRSPKPSERRKEKRKKKPRSLNLVKEEEEKKKKKKKKKPRNPNPVKEEGKKEKKRRKNTRDRTHEKKGKEKKGRLVKRCGSLCVFNYKNVIKLWVMENENI